MDLVPGFQVLVQGLAPAMTYPNFASLCTTVSNWLFSGRAVVTRMIVAAGSGAAKHFSSYHRLFSTALWSLGAMALAVLTMLEPFLGEVVMLGHDDTLARKRGVRMFVTGMHHDPLSWTRSLAFVHCGKTKRGKGTKFMVAVDGRGAPLGVRSRLLDDHDSTASQSLLALLDQDFQGRPVAVWP